MEEIEQHYNQIEEKDRLGSGLGLLEKERTRLIITRYLEGSNVNILDIGGAAGVYSFWLAELGHEVHLADATAKHIEQAKAINQQAKAKLASIAQGDARDLGRFKAGTADYILLFGPLYHLVNKEERLKALEECFRVLKKGGRLFAAGINRYASLYDGLSRGLIDDPYFVNLMKQDLLNGQHRNPLNHLEYFTTTIFQLPEEMKEELVKVKFSILNTIPVEGPMWFIQSFEDRWKNEDKRAQLFNLLNFLEQDKISLLLTLHYIVVAEK